ncbi:MAG TPA: hypothetical protein GX710_03055 [Clostridiales bacterium]|nr:hypothetical protein [Clostridiales bacterium]
MRVTQNSMSRNYINNLNSTLLKYNKSMDKVSSGRRFTKMSESVADGSRALRLRAQIYKNEQMQRNLSTVQEELNVAETNMMSVKGVLDTAHEQALKVQNGINEPDNEYQIYSSVFNSYKDQVFQWSNAVYGDKYLFGGTNNGGYPFSLNSSGEMEYNGVNVNDISKDADGYFVFGTPPEKVPYSDEIYVDVGLNLSVDGGKLDKKTALNISVSGLDSFGFGTTNVDYLSVDGTMKNFDVPNNIYVIFDEMAKALDTKDMDKFAALDLQLTEQSRKMMVEVADLGVRGNYLTSTLSRYEDEELTLIEMQTNVEKINDSEEITTMRSHEYSWQLTLQFGSSFLPQSLMDYLR